MASEKRWRDAQIYEKSYWEKAAGRIKSGSSGLTFYRWRAKNMQEMLRKAFPNDLPSWDQAKVVEIGSGAVGAVAFLEAAERYAIDPLCEFYSSLPELVVHRNPLVSYLEGRGEALPFESASVDLVIIENVIDHVQDADAVMSEIRRVLKLNGILFLTVNLHPKWGSFVHDILARYNIDRGHPHTFTLAKIQDFLEQHGFSLKHAEWDDYRQIRKRDLQSPSLSDKLKAVSGLSEFLYTSVSTKDQ